MNSIFEHVVHEVRVWLDEVIQGTQDFQILSFLLVEQIESYLILVQLHFVDGGLEFISLVINHLFSLLDLFLLLLELLDLLVDLLLHHLEEVLMLDF